MIIVKLMGGLGNQMFQYAAARRLALRHDVPLKLDLSFLEGDQNGNTPRRFALDCFAINAGKASRREVVLMSGQAATRPETFLARVSRKICHYTDYRERFFRFDPKVLCLPDNTYLEGYWQSEQYYTDYAETIRREFMVKQPLLGRNRELADEIRSVNAVSVHIRRGDYVTDLGTNAVHGLCSTEYYRKAEEMIVQSVEKPVFFVFSDDPEWVEVNFEPRCPVIYSNRNGEVPYEDLRLMSLCRHHIIANSSFSWWGAWLSVNPDKIVIAPERWFNDPSINTVDLIPVGWHRI